MAVGRPPTPTHLKVISGNPGKRPLNDQEPQLPNERPKYPKGFSAEEKACWDVVCSYLEKMGICSVVDSMAMERLIKVYMEIMVLTKTIESEGFTYQCETKGGGIMLRAHPAVALLADADRRFRQWLVEFGLTPSSRSRIKVDASQNPQDQIADYFTAG